MSATTHTRPVRPVTLPGGDLVHVRGLTLAELRRVDAAVESVENLGERAMAAAVLVVASALVTAAGIPIHADPATAEAREQVAEGFTPDQLDAVFTAAVGRTKAEAKN